MAIRVDIQFHLPATTTGPAFSTLPVGVLGSDGQDWRGVQEATLRALGDLSREHGIDAVAWSCAVLPHQSEETHGHRLGVVFAYTGEARDAHVATLAAGLGEGWSSEGFRAIPRRAFPSLALQEGAAYQLWVEGRRGLSAPRLVVDEGELLQTRLAAGTAKAEDFLPDVLHALGVTTPSPQSGGDDSLEAYKVVFALSVCERILEADGEIAEPEVEFLRRVFPTARLERLGLLDRIRFLSLRQEAASELTAHMTHDARLTLMGLFWRAGQSDGDVDATELQILRDAASQLHLDWDEVEAYLHEIW